MKVLQAFHAELLPTIAVAMSILGYPELREQQKEAILAFFFAAFQVTQD